MVAFSTFWGAPALFLPLTACAGSYCGRNGRGTGAPRHCGHCGVTVIAPVLTVMPLFPLWLYGLILWFSVVTVCLNMGVGTLHDSSVQYCGRNAAAL